MMGQNMGGNMMGFGGMNPGLNPMAGRGGMGPRPVGNAPPMSYAGAVKVSLYKTEALGLGVV